MKIIQFKYLCVALAPFASAARQASAGASSTAAAAVGALGGGGLLAECRGPACLPSAPLGALFAHSRVDEAAPVGVEDGKFVLHCNLM